MKIKIITGALFLLGSLGCSSSKITSVWTAPPEHAPKYQKIMVLAVVNKADRSIQEKMENHLAGDLVKTGYSAVTALETYGPKAFEQLTEKQILPKITASNADALVTIVLLRSRREKTYVQPDVNYYGSLSGYVHGQYRMIHEEGYYVTNMKYLWETNFYELPSGKLMYSAQTVSFSPSSIESMGHEYGRLLIKNMVKKGVLSENQVVRD
ncbi:hypothetical protein [Ferruginibacter sp. HRS2-29]|uniref:hypothetical protein n=1 Tax=Ferruginibacter sp. HRS2-29 TaxID=2487334 RepID=UPI0020CEBADA|nr:hypothetical protein [Ferruginibacter sp. HRS2-29]MCP9753162.1 hypothetical protein [Ferruginibacter sp. HRS2-29]